jgi:hypothetical protein
LLKSTAPTLSNNQKVFCQYHDTDKALHNQLLATVPAVYLSTLSNPTIGFGNVSCLKLLTHLKTHNGFITPFGLDANMDHMKPGHPPTTIKALYLTKVALSLPPLAPILPSSKL